MFGRPLERQILNQHGERVGEHRRAGRHDPPPVTAGKQEHVEDDAVREPERVDAKMPPAGQPDRVAEARKS